jgi:tetratricopeptide (TPR) repeat protein
MLLAGAHAGPQALARFQIEAEAVASLHHPNIVQVYEVGEHDQCPYLALEYVDGGSLDRQLNRKPQPVQEAAALVETLARAIHVAHLRGIIHRDLKPANVLLAARGLAAESAKPQAAIPKITDFGLAKRLEGESQTFSGSVLGTPSYMAPEQALGKQNDVGPHSDVYSLGAILYECLTGQPPFRGDSPVETLTLVQTVKVRPPSQVRKEPLPRDLETICLKCLQRETGRRYVSAEELADDLKRFLNREPIKARPAGRVERLVMWARRRPAAAGLVVVSILALATLAAVGFWSHLRIRAARDRAERRSELARAAIDDMYTQVAEQWLGDEPLQDKLQYEFLMKALRLYEQLAEEDDNDPALRHETGKAQFRMGQIFRQLGRNQEAEKAYDRALDIQKQLLEHEPDDRDFRRDLANTFNWRGELLRTTNRPQVAREDFQQAMRLQKQLAEKYPDKPVYRHKLALSLNNHGLVLAESEPKAAQHDYEEAIDLLRKVIDERRDDPGPQQDQARAYLNLGVLLDSKGSYPEAGTAYNQAIQRLDALHRQNQHKPEYRFELAVALNNLGNLQSQRLHQLEEAQKTFDAARIHLERLVGDFPSRPRYREELANAFNGLGALEFEKKRYREAESPWLKATELFAKLVADAPGTVQYLYRNGMAHGNLGLLHLRHLDNLPLALKELETATQSLTRAAEMQPDRPSVWHDLSTHYRYLGRAALKSGDIDGAVAAARDSASARHAEDRERYLAALLLAECAAQQIRPQRAQEITDQVLQLLLQVDVKRFPRATGAEKEPAFAPLVKREEFKELFARWKTGQTRP